MPGSHGGIMLAASAAVLLAAACSSGHPAPQATVTVTRQARPPSSAAPSPSPPSPSPSAAQGIGNGPGYPAGGPPADITVTGGCTLSGQGDPAVGNLYYTVHTVLAVSAPGEITINSADVEVIGPGGDEIGSLQVMPVGSSPTISQPLVVTSGTVPFTGVADQFALSGQSGPACRVVSIAYDDGNTAP